MVRLPIAFDTILPPSQTIPTMRTNASTAAPEVVPIGPNSIAASGVWNSRTANTTSSQASSDSTSVTNPRMAPSTAAPPIERRTTISSAVRSIVVALARAGGAGEGAMRRPVA